ncbi:murein transglycosylase A [Rhizobiales bacterium]|uniref:murein transglycosylase A n=1 Tax=Hongsoonwoonella zoysiae TaxID=2821844 RepID=UPI001560E578|nr:murein transglycosylase A [Hongsoonwoonella zoysiae]NRG16772.1 murein transglycosylase A [Hongsoonwoonella zoysiae]
MGGGTRAFAACASLCAVWLAITAPASGAKTVNGPELTPVDFNDLAGWVEEDHAAALSAFVRHCDDGRRNPAKSGALGVDAAALAQVCRTARGVEPSRARAFLEENFRPVRIEMPGFVTGYFEPELEGSRSRIGKFTVPLLSKPDDLVKVTDENRPRGFDPVFAFARKLDNGRLVEHPDRGEIMNGALDGRGLELVWLADPVDAFYVHIQGSARIRLTDGGVMRVGYAAKTGHPYFPIGRVMIERGLADPGTVTMDVLRGWLAENPDEVDGVLRRNRSYIFFREVKAGGPDAGPVGAADIPLIAGRSLAVDKALHTFGTPVFVEAELPTGRDGTIEPFRRLMIAEDTGSAIVGPARGDIFIGSGGKAGDIAGRIQHEARFTLLVPKGVTLAGEVKR